jgi:hypothetical protein
VVEQDARGGERVQPEEQRGGEEAEPDQQQPGVAVVAGGAVDGEREPRGERRRHGHQPEVARVVLPHDVAGGTASRSHSPASGSARWNAQMTTRARLPRRTAAVAVA